ncbi:MAG: hypothetical protein N3A38_12815, partial [Planctomycetota bacterium]|nr:hypothetical protein [Planctomycetota bacterium]
VRIADSADTKNPELGVKFMNAPDEDRKLLKDFIEARIAEAAKAKAAATATGPNAGGVPGGDERK